MLQKLLLTIKNAESLKIQYLANELSVILIGCGQARLGISKVKANSGSDWVIELVFYVVEHPKKLKMDVVRFAESNLKQQSAFILRISWGVKFFACC